MNSEIASRFLHVGRATFDVAMGIIFPTTCGGCGCAGSWLCDRCEAGLAEIDLLGPQRARSPVDAGMFVAARFVFANPVRRAVHLLKYHGERSRAEWFAEQIEPLLPSRLSPGLILEPVPLTPERQRHRGFNQSHEIAKHLSESTEVALGSNLRRIRETRPQVELSGLERLNNVLGAFVADDGVAGRHVILVDDVVTTGATMRECAMACLVAGALSVSGIAAARSQFATDAADRPARR